MVDARRRVHAAGLYQPLADAIVELFAGQLGGGVSLLDLGCGEGFYSINLLRQMGSVELHAVDVSRPAVRLAARACPDGEFAVASSFAVPLPDAGVDGAFSVFAPTSETELRRLVAPGGFFLNVAPGPEHLWQLRQMLYAQPRAHPAPANRLDGFDESRQHSLAFELNLEGQQLQDVIAMTPYAYGGRREQKQQLAELRSMRLQTAFVLSLHRRGPA